MGNNLRNLKNKNNRMSDICDFEPDNPDC